MSHSLVAKRPVFGFRGGLAGLFRRSGPPCPVGVGEVDSSALENISLEHVEKPEGKYADLIGLSLEWCPAVADRSEDLDFLSLSRRDPPWARKAPVPDRSGAAWM